MRMSIVGLPASGKTTLAEAISKKLSIPHIHLDRFWFEAGGLNTERGASREDKEKVRSYIRQKVAEAMKADSWVSDGFYSNSVQPEISKRANTIIFLNIPLWRTLLNHAMRIFKPSNRHRELGLWHEFTFFFEIVRRQFAHKPKLEKFVKENKNKVIELKSRKEIDELYVRSLG